MKRLLSLTLALLFSGAMGVYGQTKPEPDQLKKDQRDLENDFYVSYGTGTLYYFIENDNMKGNSMTGTFLGGYARSVNDVIAVGFQLSYTWIERSEIYSNYYYDTTQYVTRQTNSLWQGMANVRFRYVNSETFCMYSGIGMGVTMNYKNTTNSPAGTSVKEQQILPAGQLTLLGFRIGRSLSFFGEFGLGTNSILCAGVSYKFKD